MHGENVFSFLDTALLMAPIAALMLLTLFRLDERVAKVQIRGRRRNSFCEVSPSGRGVLFDPDGTCVSRHGFPPPTGKARSRRAASVPGERRGNSGRSTCYPIKIKRLTSKSRNP
jgi:hypothetical protein